MTTTLNTGMCLVSIPAGATSHLPATTSQREEATPPGEGVGARREGEEVPSTPQITTDTATSSIKIGSTRTEGATNGRDVTTTGTALRQRQGARGDAVTVAGALTTTTNIITALEAAGSIRNESL